MMNTTQILTIGAVIIVAAAAVAVIALLTIWGSLSHSQNEPIMADNEVARADSVTPVVTHEEVQTDTTHQERRQDVHERPKKRSLRKSQPTITDYDKAYALMAQAEQAKARMVEATAQAEQVKAKMEIFNAQMAAHGYVPVMQEDGTIVYINEQENLIAYEE